MEEADARSAASRAYYAVFHVAVEKTSRLASYTGAGDHGKLLDVARRAWPSARFREFMTLQDARVDADYMLNRRFSVERARALHQLAIRLTGELDGRQGRE